MIIFKTRREVKQLQKQLEDLEAMLVTHFGIRYTMEHFRQYQDRHPDATIISVTDGEWYHFEDMVQPSNPSTEMTPANSLSFRSLELIKKED